MLRVVGGKEFTCEDRGVAIIIPARFGSTRFPGKSLAELRGVSGAPKSLLLRSWEAANRVDGVDEIWIATDDIRIRDAAEQFGARVVMTSSDCRNGTERCTEAVLAADIKSDLIVNFQGDAPLTPPLAVEALIQTMHDAPCVEVATTMVRCSPVAADCLRVDETAGRSRATTVVFDRNFDALYFSRSIIPFVPERMARPPVYLHVGVFGYRRDALMHYPGLEPSVFEETEGLEQLRFLDAGIPIRMIEVGTPPGGVWEVDCPSDLVSVEAALVERHLH
ncbi:MULTISPECIES: 3-deoxy-manno-octulosonate cytidylyltransferase [Sphingomonadales]|uniref:3-deoxy-manno-octulosonate cytidylyltransferase n=1 Tax=Sphingomonadales TaxID=204457 RepID=UPI000686169D|nr:MULTISPECIES: 3-deoxy-manno-octulosonate cytidylyltransferase [Sphingomonadaceae]WQE08157.1 3-deoxy-manno-octulosonate cytidylyltransferase [Sphingobium yanoikuyae]